MSTKSSVYYGRLGHLYKEYMTWDYRWDSPRKRFRSIWVPSFIGKRWSFWRWFEAFEYRAFGTFDGF